MKVNSGKPQRIRRNMREFGKNTTKDAKVRESPKEVEIIRENTKNPIEYEKNRE